MVGWEVNVEKYNKLKFLGLRTSAKENKSVYSKLFCSEVSIGARQDNRKTLTTQIKIPKVCTIKLILDNSGSSTVSRCDARLIELYCVVLHLRDVNNCTAQLKGIFCSSIRVGGIKVCNRICAKLSTNCGVVCAADEQITADE